MKNKKKIIIGLIVFILIVCVAIAIIIYNSSFSTTPKTLLIYMCGSNLESEKGLAGRTINEILAAKPGSNVNIVIQTGGAQDWKSYDIKNDTIQRYEVKNGKLELIATLDNANMGEEQTLTDFLKWGQEKYNNEHYMLVLWDHGAGPIDGIAFDENYNYDSLSLLELKSALSNAKFPNKIDIIGFDACLMASIETAAVIQDYANYMVASEEIETPGGWDFKAVVESYSKLDDLPEVGKIICDSYMKKCIDSNKGSYPTLSVIDLSYTNEVLKQFDDYLYMIKGDLLDLDYSYISEAIHSTEKFGGGDLFKSNANMIDILDFLYQSDKYLSFNYVDLCILLKGEFVTYSVHNANRRAYGVSFYYPENYVQEDIEKFTSLDVNKNYNQFLKDVFLNVPEKTIELSNKGSKSTDDAFSVSISKNSTQYFKLINYAIMTTDEDKKQHILFVDNNIVKDWDNLTFKVKNKENTIALNNNRLFYKVVANTPEFISYIAPIKINGEKTYLNFVYVKEDETTSKGYYYIVGASKGYDENGLPDNDIIPLEKGDRIQVVTDVLADNEYIENYGKEFVIDDKGIISEIPLNIEQYQCEVIISDIFGNTFKSNIVTFENGIVTNIEELID